MSIVFEPRYTWLDRVDSTNNYCMRLANDSESEGIAVAAHFQEQGKGQRGNTWESEDSKNLTFSLLLRPVFLKVEEQFLVSKMIALSIIEWLKINNVDALIKWPNDIYVGEKKIAGILIENSFSGPMLEVSILGVGLNLNQIEFSKDIPNPTSMFLLTGNQYRPEIVITEIMVSIQMRYMQLMYGLKDLVSNDYLKSLYKYQQLSDYATSEGKFKAKIVGVKPTGELILETEQGQIKSFGFKEVSFEI